MTSHAKQRPNWESQALLLAGKEGSETKHKNELQKNFLSKTDQADCFAREEPLICFYLEY